MGSLYLKNPYMFYYRKLRYYPMFFGEAYTSPYLKRIIGTRIKDYIFVYINEIGYSIVNKDDFKKCSKFTFRKFKSNPRQLKKLLDLTAIYAKRGINLLQKRLRALKKASNSEIKNLVQKYNKIQTRIQAIEDAPTYFIEEPAHQELKEKLKKSFKDGKKVQNIMRTLINLDYPSFLTQEAYELAKIVKYGNRKILKGHIKKWKHYRFDYWGPVTPAKEFKERYNQLKRESDRCDKILFNYEHYSQIIRDQKKKIIRKYNLDKKTVILANIVSAIGLLDDNKKFYLTKLTYLFDKILSEIARRNKIPKNWIHWLLPEEVENLAVGKYKITASMINKRKQKSLLFCQNGVCRCITRGKELDHYTDFISSTLSLRKDQAYFKGLGVYNAKYKGRVVVMYSHKDIKKAKKGMVLVATKTTVDFLSILKLAGGVITDYGGLTSHTAIAAREFRIPAVVGTKIATRILKDGDIVEVDGGKGLVKIIKSV